MNSITIATKTTRTGTRLQTAVSQAFQRGSDPKAMALRTVTGTGQLEGHRTHLPGTPLTCPSGAPRSSDLPQSRHPPSRELGRWEGVWASEQVLACCWPPVFQWPSARPWAGRVLASLRLSAEE